MENSFTEIRNVFLIGLLSLTLIACFPKQAYRIMNWASGTSERLPLKELFCVIPTSLPKTIDRTREFACTQATQLKWSDLSIILFTYGEGMIVSLCIGGLRDKIEIVYSQDESVLDYYWNESPIPLSQEDTEFAQKILSRVKKHLST